MCPHGYTSVKRTQQLSGVTRIRTHDLLIRYLITKQWRPVLSQLGHHPNPKIVGSMAQLYWVELSLTSHHTQIWSCRVLLPPTSTAAAAHTLHCLYMGVYYTSVKRTQQLSGVTRIRTHDLLIRYLITKQWRPVLSQLGHHPNPKKVGSMAQLYWVELSLTSHHTQIWSCRVLLPPTSTAAAAHTLHCLYMGVYYTSVKRTQQLSGVTRIRTHDLLIRYLITKQWRPVLSQLYIYIQVQFIQVPLR